MAGVHRCNETEIEQLINGLRERIHLSQVVGTSLWFNRYTYAAVCTCANEYVGITSVISPEGSWRLRR